MRLRRSILDVWELVSSNFGVGPLDFGARFLSLGSSPVRGGGPILEAAGSGI